MESFFKDNTIILANKRVSEKIGRVLNIISEYDSDGKVIRRKSAAGTAYYDYNYNHKGLLESITFGNKTTQIFKYDDNNRLLEVITYPIMTDTDIYTADSIVYTAYNDKGLKKYQKIIYGQQHVLETSYEYNENNQLIRTIAPFSDICYTYDDNNRLIEERYNFAHNSISNIIILKYDDNGNLVEKLGSRYRAEYEYNNDGLPTKITEYYTSYDDSVRIVIRTIEYTNIGGM